MKKIKADKILFRLTKYGKWQQLDTETVFNDQLEILDYFIQRYDSGFIQIRVNGVESTIKK